MKKMFTVILLLCVSFLTYAQPDKTYYLLDNALKNPEDVYILDLMKMQLNALPESIGNLVNLRELKLSVNEIESLPKNIGNLKNLSHFEYNYVRNFKIPAEKLWKPNKAETH